MGEHADIEIDNALLHEDLYYDMYLRDLSEEQIHEFRLLRVLNLTEAILMTDEIDVNEGGKWAKKSNG